MVTQKKAARKSSSQREPAQDKEAQPKSSATKKGKGHAKAPATNQAHSTKRGGAKKLTKANQAIQDKYFGTQQEDEAKEGSSRQSTQSEEAMDDGEERDLHQDGKFSSFISSTSASSSDITYLIRYQLSKRFSILSYSNISSSILTYNPL